MESFDVNGVRLAATVSGTPGRKPLILLHSGGSTRSTWDSVAPAFELTHRVYAIDMRGYGDSDRCGDYSFSAMRDDVIGILDRIGADRVHMIGHSLGGSIAWLVAQRQPDRVERLVIEDSPPAKPGVDRINLGPRPQEELPYAWEAIEQVVAQLNHPDPDWWERLDAVTAHVLLLAGGPPSHVPQHLFAEAQALLKDARVVEIPVGHHIHREAPERFLAAVVPFLSEELE